MQIPLYINMVNIQYHGYHMILWYCHNAFVRKWLVVVFFFLSVLKTKHNDFSFGRLNTSMYVISDVECLGIMRADGVR